MGDIPQRDSHAHNKPNTFRMFWQRCLFSLALLMVVFSLKPLERMEVPGVNHTYVYAALALSIFFAIIHFPYVFWKLPSKLRKPACVALLGSSIFTFAIIGDSQQAYEKTPQGAAEAADRHWKDVLDAAERQKQSAVEAAEQSERNKAQRLVERMADTQKQLQELQEKLESCFSWGHRLPALENPVKESLHNPEAFEHVRTDVIVPDSERNNVVMMFRAENGFGAIRTGSIRAQLLADTCEVQNIGEFQTE
ncbi:hypothetical protein BH11PSE5_BH11PSE5_30110 [soil metagenome]